MCRSVDNWLHDGIDMIIQQLLFISLNRNMTSVIGSFIEFEKQAIYWN